MSLIEGIGDEVTHFFLLLFAGFIAYIAWWSTNISEQRQYRTVLLLDRRSHPTRSILRVRVPSRQLTNHTETVTISEGASSQQSNESTSSISSPTNLNSSLTSGETEIYNKRQDISESTPNDVITIKLKYINDDIKIVDGRLEELLGDFKRRHFVEEINANKAVKLIFNGQVLRQDHQSLQSCGMFDNCVVHCLIHQKRLGSVTDRDRTQESTNEVAPPFLRNNSLVHIANNVNNNNQGIDWDLGNFLFFLVSFILLAAWYFRYVYAHLYTVTATVGLIIITGVFSVVLFGVYFPDNEVADANFRIRVTRTERIEVQQQ